MISGINGASSFMENMGIKGMRPDPKEGFNNADVNGDGGLDKSEMQTVVDKISEMSSQDISVDDIFSEFDVDEDGLLSEQEAETAMAQLREEMGPPPMGPPPNCVTAYAENEADSYLTDLLNSLKEEEESLMDALTNNSEEEEDDEESSVVDMLKTAMEDGSYSPLDILA